MDNNVIGLIIAFFLIGIYSFGIKPALKEKQLNRERQEKAAEFDRYSQSYNEGKAYIANGESEKGRDKLLLSLYLPVAPVELSGLNSANIDIYRKELSNRVSDISKFVDHNKAVISELENLYANNKSSVSLVEAYMLLDVSSDSLKRFYGEQEKIINLGEKSFFPATSASKEGITEHEFKKRIESELKATLKLAGQFQSDAVNSFEAFKKSVPDVSL